MLRFVTLEGPDGSGKSTQARLLAAWLRARGEDVLLTREPGGTEIGDQARQILMAMANRGMRPETEFLLFSASRAQLVRDVIEPHLNNGGTVVCDRYADSSLAYQGYGHRLPLQDIQAVNSLATGGLVPDLTFLLDLPAEEGLRRRREHGTWNRLDDYDPEFHKRVREGYHALARGDPKRWVTIDATKDEETVQKAIREVWR